MKNKRLSLFCLAMVVFVLFATITGCDKEDSAEYEVPVNYSDYVSEYLSREEFISILEANEDLLVCITYCLDIAPYDVRADYTDLELDMSNPNVYNEKVAYYTYYSNQLFEGMGVDSNSEDYRISLYSIGGSVDILFESLDNYLKYESQFVNDMKSNTLLKEIQIRTAYRYFTDS